MALPPRISAEQMRRAFYKPIFEMGLDRLREAYKGSVSVLNPAQAESIVRRRSGLSELDPIPDAVRDDDGSVVFDFYEEASELHEEISSIRDVVQRAFLIALFHFYEKESNKWVNGNGYRHNAVVAWLNANGSAKEERELKKLELIANCLKHGPGRSCSELHNDFHSLFAVGILPSDRTLLIDGSLLESLFDAVAASGPK